MHTGTLTVCPCAHCWHEWTGSHCSNRPCHNTYRLSLFSTKPCWPLSTGFCFFFLGFTAPVGSSSARTFLFFPHSWPPALLIPEMTRSNLVRPRLKSFSHAAIGYVPIELSTVYFAYSTWPGHLEAVWLHYHAKYLDLACGHRHRGCPSLLSLFCWIHNGDCCQWQSHWWQYCKKILRTDLCFEDGYVGVDIWHPCTNLWCL